MAMPVLTRSASTSINHPTQPRQRGFALPRRPIPPLTTSPRSQGHTDGHDSDYWAEMARYHRERSTAITVDITARIEVIDQTLAAIKHLTGLSKRSHSLPEELELIGKYESHNNRQLKQAIDQLQQLQSARQSSDGISLNVNKGP